jgi:hypothetical protein
MFSQILSRLEQKSDIDLLRQEVDLMLDALYMQEGKYLELVRSEVRNWVLQAVDEEIASLGISREKYLKDLQEALTKFNLLELKVAFEPTSSNIENIHNWARKNISEYIVLELIYDPKLIGGAIITYKGKYLDLSLVKKFDLAFKEITSNLKLPGSNQNEKIR